MGLKEKIQDLSEEYHQDVVSIRRFLHKKLKHGKISGRFYKFLYRNFPYRLTGRNVSIIVREVLDGNMTEDKAIAWLQKDDNELRRQKEMAKSNWECRKNEK